MRYLHLRCYNDDGTVDNRGGLTIGYTFHYLHEEDRCEVTFAIALCNYKDNFCRKIGRAIVEGRMENDECWKYTYAGDADFRLVDELITKAFTKVQQVYGVEYIE
jgi:hypothetical protein